MPIEIPNATARCSDCMVSVEGGLQLDASPDIYAVLICEVRGNLIMICNEHHDTNRLPGTSSEDEAPQHDHFYIVTSNEFIGILGPVSAKAALAKMLIMDAKLAKRFQDEVLAPLQEIDKRRFFGPKPF